MVHTNWPTPLPERGTPDDRIHCERMALSIRQAMAANGFSTRQMGRALGISEGTINKYLRIHDREGISPYRVGFGIMRHLAVALGVTMEQLDRFYETGEFEEGIGAVALKDVEQWIRNRAIAGDLPALMASMQAATERITGEPPAASGAEVEPEPEPLAPWTWPLEALDEAGVSGRIRERMGLDPRTLDGLVHEGVYSDEVVEALSILLNIDEEEIRLACERRRAPGAL